MKKIIQIIKQNRDSLKISLKKSQQKAPILLLQANKNEADIEYHALSTNSCTKLKT